MSVGFWGTNCSVLPGFRVKLVTAFWYFIHGNLLTSRCFQCELIERQNFSTSLQHSDTSTLGESECTDGQLGDIEESKRKKSKNCF